MAGMEEPFGAGSVLTQWSVDPATFALTAVVLGGYVVGVRRLSAKDVRWPAGRTVAFLAGITVLVVATQSGLAAYDTVLFSVHVTQHLLLGMAAPVLLALGAPVTLALQASSRPVQRTLLRVLHRPLVRGLTHPVAGWALFGGSLFVLYFTPVFEASLRSETVHVLVHLHFVAAGSLFFWPLVGSDPVPRPLPYGARIVAVLLAVPFHAVLGVALLGTDTLLADGFYAEVRPDWAVAPLTDQRTGAGILWGVGDLLGLVVTLVIARRWMAAEERAGRRADRLVDQSIG